MNRLICGGVILLLMSVPVISYGQDEQYRLSPGEYAVAVGLGSLEEGTALSGSFFYGVSEDISGFTNIVGFVSGGLGFADEDLAFPGLSVPPIPIFAVGFRTSDRLGRTGLDYRVSVTFAAAFGKVVNEATDRSVMTSRAMGAGVGFGFAKEIATESNLVIVPSAGIDYSYTWTTFESSIVDTTVIYIYFTETESDADWGSQIGLAVRVSPQMSVGGSVGFSFEESNIMYGLSLLFRPH